MTMQHFVKGSKGHVSVESVFHLHVHFVQVDPINAMKQLQDNLFPEVLV